MKYSAVFPRSHNNFKLLFLLVVWAATFVVSADAQEILSATVVRSESDFSYFAERSIETDAVTVPATVTDVKRMLTLPKNVQIRFSRPELQLPSNGSGQLFETR